MKIGLVTVSISALLFVVLCDVNNQVSAAETETRSARRNSPTESGADRSSSPNKKAFFENLTGSRTRIAKAGADASNGLVSGMIIGRDAYTIGKSAAQGTKDAYANTKTAWKDKKYLKSIGYGSVTAARPVLGAAAVTATGLQRVGTAVGGALASATQLAMSPLSAARSRMTKNKATHEQNYDKVNKHIGRWHAYLDKSTDLHGKMASFVQGRGPLTERRQSGASSSSAKSRATSPATSPRS